MVNYIWVGMMVIGFIVAGINGTMDKVNEAIFTSAKEAVTLSFGMISILVFWLGIMKIAEKGGLLDVLAILFRPIVKRLFPDIPKITRHKVIFSPIWQRIYLDSGTQQHQWESKRWNS